MTVKVIFQNGIYIAKFENTSKIVLADTINIRNSICPYTEEVGSKIILDFSNIIFIDSSGIGTIISLFKKSKMNNISIVLCNISSQVFDLFRMLNLTSFFNIEPNIDCSLKKLTPPQ